MAIDETLDEKTIPEEPESRDPVAAEEPAGQEHPVAEDTIETEAAEPSPEEAFSELNDRYLRLLAEFENFRRRTAKERETVLEIARADTVDKFLPVYDNLERAISQETSDEAYKKGVELIMKQFTESLSKLGVSEIPTDGAFDPELHNAVMHIEDDALPEKAISEVFQKGFRLGERVIRHAVVKVAN
ncbi:nucleotide exchange factor GrpE [Oscillospiraceae bacterium OttesenSCG-928-G22]|nr:nucleotide exchange factor GrpE [Oscillospiraceae bacterium OttesenSCG-928-G22]